MANEQQLNQDMINQMLDNQYSGSGYYACIDSSTRELKYVFNSMITPTNSGGTFVEVTESQYSYLISNPNTIIAEDGSFKAYTPTFDRDNFVKQAQSALQFARTTVTNNFGMLNEPTPDTWVSYLKALMAIVNGTDTTSSKLPEQPSI